MAITIEVFLGYNSIIILNMKIKNVLLIAQLTFNNWMMLLFSVISIPAKIVSAKWNFK